MTKSTKCIIPLLNINKKIFTNKDFVDCRIVDMFDKFIEIKLKYNADYLNYLVKLAKENNTFFKVEYKNSYLHMYFLIPEKYNWITTIAIKDCSGLSKTILDNALDYWTSY